MRLMLLALLFAASISTNAMAADFRLTRVDQDTAEVIDLAAIHENSDGLRNIVVYLAKLSASPTYHDPKISFNYAAFFYSVDCTRRKERTERIAVYNQKFVVVDNVKKISPWVGPETMDLPQTWDFEAYCADEPSGSPDGEKIAAADWKEALLFAGGRIASAQASKQPGPPARRNGLKSPPPSVARIALQTGPLEEIAYSSSAALFLSRGDIVYDHGYVTATTYTVNDPGYEIDGNHVTQILSSGLTLT